MDETQLVDAVLEMERLARELMPLLLHGNDPRMELLRLQYQEASVAISDASLHGFYADISVPANAIRVEEPDHGAGDAVIPVKGEKHPAGCILYVVEGVLKFLEVYNHTAWVRPPVFETPNHIQPFVFKASAASPGQGA